MKSTFLFSLGLTSLLASATSLAAVSNERAIAKDSANCKIMYNDTMGERGLLRKCAKKESSYFKLEDTSAPMLESKTVKAAKASYLVTRWGTGQSEEVILLDLSSATPKVAARAISDGPSKITVDKDHVNVQIAVREGPDATANISTKNLVWPVIK